MPDNQSVMISGAVEGPIDEVVLKRLLSYIGAIPGPIHITNGKGKLLNKLNGYNHAARYNPWVVLIDLDYDKACAPPFIAQKLPDPGPWLCFRVAVREVEAWLLADQEHLATFLSIPKTRIPTAPEALNAPKRTMVDLARHSRRSAIREDMVPRPESGRKIGPAYNSRLIEFVSDTVNGWRPDVAAQRSESLERCLKCMQALAKNWRNR
ncbi:MAG: hypothetical protein JRI95_11870 [Deltaproteobacteria bacterium]|nr:hypothetical protein [Deltaproteobacteria bacterium]